MKFPAISPHPLYLLNQQAKTYPNLCVCVGCGSHTEHHRRCCCAQPIALPILASDTAHLSIPLLPRTTKVQLRPCVLMRGARSGAATALLPSLDCIVLVCSTRDGAHPQTHSEQASRRDALKTLNCYSCSYCSPIVFSLDKHMSVCFGLTRKQKKHKNARIV